MKLAVGSEWKPRYPDGGYPSDISVRFGVVICMHHSVFIIDLLPDPLIGGYSSDIRHPNNGFGVQALPAKTKGLGFK